jgi:hypothetical protein
MLGLLIGSDPIVETTPDDSEAVVLGVSGEDGPTLLDTFELASIARREEPLTQGGEPERTPFS